LRWFAGAVTFIWCVVFYFLTTSSPEDHPRISEEEKLYLRNCSCKNAGAGKASANLPLPWKSMLFSLPVHVLWITHFSSAWTFYLIALNLPLFINETFNLGIVNVSKLNFVGSVEYITIVDRTGWCAQFRTSASYFSTTRERSTTCCSSRAGGAPTP
jgi:hypothetical protein